MPPSARHCEVAVLGVGGVGSAAVYHLARRGVDVVGLERFDVPHARGSSNGRTRLFQRALDADPAAVTLADRARDLWTDLEAATGRDLLVETGSLAVGPGDADPVASARRAADRHGFDHELLSGTEATDRFAIYDFPDGSSVLYQPDGAVLAAERGVVAHVSAALDHGADVRARERVCDWEVTDDGVRVETDREVYEAEKLVVAAGGWAGETVDALSGLVEPCRHATAWFGPGRGDSADTGEGNSREPVVAGPDGPPAFVATVDGEDYYGIPGLDLPGMKVGRGDFRPTAPDDLSEPTQRDERPLRRFVDSCVPGAAGPSLRRNAGIVTRSPDGQFIVDILPETDRVAVAAGLSGRGYKFAPVIGEVLADLVTEGGTDHEIDQYSLDRFD